MICQLTAGGGGGKGGGSLGIAGLGASQGMPGGKGGTHYVGRVPLPSSAGVIVAVVGGLLLALSKMDDSGDNSTLYRSGDSRALPLNQDWLKT